MHANDWYRLERALEVALTTSQKGSDPEAAVPPSPSAHSSSSFTGIRSQTLSRKYDFRCFFLIAAREDLCRLIDRRCLQMVEGGLLEETAHLLAAGTLNPSSPPGRAIGYRQTIQYLSKEGIEGEMAEATALQVWRWEGACSEPWLLSTKPPSAHFARTLRSRHPSSSSAQSLVGIFRGFCDRHAALCETADGLVPRPGRVHLAALEPPGPWPRPRRRACFCGRRRGQSPSEARGGRAEGFAGRKHYGGQAHEKVRVSCKSRVDGGQARGLGEKGPGMPEAGARKTKLSAERG